MVLLRSLKFPSISMVFARLDVAVVALQPQPHYEDEQAAAAQPPLKKAKLADAPPAFAIFVNEIDYFNSCTLCEEAWCDQQQRPYVWVMMLANNVVKGLSQWWLGRGDCTFGRVEVTCKFERVDSVQ
jgi:hypothetical protein